MTISSDIQRFDSQHFVLLRISQITLEEQNAFRMWADRYVELGGTFDGYDVPDSSKELMLNQTFTHNFPQDEGDAAEAWRLAMLTRITTLRDVLIARPTEPVGSHITIHPTPA